jgi:hypothetical protein
VGDDSGRRQWATTVGDDSADKVTSTGAEAMKMLTRVMIGADRDVPVSLKAVTAL